MFLKPTLYVCCNSRVERTVFAFQDVNKIHSIDFGRLLELQNALRTFDWELMKEEISELSFVNN